MALETTGGPEIVHEYPVCSDFLACGLPIAGCPRLVNLTFDPCCGLHERPLRPLHGGIIIFAHAAFLTLRAHEATKSNSQVGLKPAVRCKMHQGPVRADTVEKVGFWRGETEFLPQEQRARFSAEGAVNLGICLVSKL
jgi:hypothetical protein